MTPPKKDNQVPKENSGTAANRIGVSEASQISRKDIEALLKLDKEQLYALLGTQLNGLNQSPSLYLSSMGAEGITGRSDIIIPYEDAIGFGRTYLKQEKVAITPKIKKYICDDLKYCDKQEEILADVEKVRLVIIGIIPLIVGAVGAPILACSVIAMLILKYYCNRLCKCK